MLTAYIILIKSYFAYLFKQNSRYEASFRTLYRSHTFRVPDELRGDRLIGLRYLKKSWVALNTSENCDLQYHKDLIYDGDPKQRIQRQSYLTELGFDAENYIAVNELPGVSLEKRLLFFLLFFPLFFLLILLTLVSKNRRSIALTILSITQNYLFLQVVKKYKIDRVIYFFPFENDANFNALMLISEGVHVIKVPGPNPLQRFNTYMVSNEVALCTGFQIEQYERLKNTWFIDGIKKWPLYGFQEFKKYLNHEIQSEYAFDLGFISSGVWKRRQLGLQSLEKDYESEELLIDWIKEYSELNKLDRLFIFLHPIESKTLELYNEATDYYREMFSGLRVGFPSFGERSYERFGEANLTLSSHSTTNLQRLFCGYKVFYTPMKYQDPLFPETTLEKICILQKEEFMKKVSKAIEINEDQFFHKYELNSYHFSSTLK